jgi:hypothetical protein
MAEQSMFQLAYGYASRADRLASLRQRIGGLQAEADTLLEQQEIDESVLRKAMTVAGKPAVRIGEYQALILEAMTGRVRVVELAFAGSLSQPASETDAEADALLALSNAIEEVNAEAEADEAAAWCKVRVVPGEAVSA